MEVGQLGAERSVGPTGPEAVRAASGGEETVDLDDERPPASASAAFDAFYLAHLGTVTASVYGLTGNWAEAQDLTQEAFARALERWSTISGYDEPVAWVRTVAHRLTISRWRRARTALRFRRSQRPVEVPPPNEDHVALVAALRSLPAAQREALVLHYLNDLSIAAIAAHAGVPEGTVKARLSRGRTALADQLREHTPGGSR